MRSSLVRGLALVLGTMLVAACSTPTAAPATSGSSAAAGGRTVCFLFQDIETEFWAAGIKVISDSFAEKGFEVVQKNSEADANKQLEQINDCIAQKVAGIMIIPQDGSTVIGMIKNANDAGIPIGVFARPPADNNPNKNLQVTADNLSIATAVNEYLASEARKKFEETGEKIKPLIMVGDLGDPNAVNRKQGFDDIIAKNQDIFLPAVEVATEWDAETGRAGLQSAMQANPDVGLLFTSSDFLWPQVEAVLEPLGKWKEISDPDHIIMGGIDGDNGMCQLMKAKLIDSSGIFNLFLEADMIVEALAKAIDAGNGLADEDLVDPGFALTQANFAEKESETWGCVIEPPQ